MPGKIFKLLKKYWLFLAILFIAVFSRFVVISQMPPSLNWDEVSHGYNAYSVLTTGKDEWGKSFPTIFRAYGDYKLPVYVYVTALSESVFGLNSFAIRLPSVLAGVGIVIFTYFLVLELLSGTEYSSQNRNRTALLAMFLTAVEPWSLFLSRAAFEANLALFFITAGVYFILKGLNNKKYLLLSSTLFGLSVWTYNSARIFVPLLLVTVIFIYRSKLYELFKANKKITLILTGITALFFIPMFIQLFDPVGQARYGKVSIIDEGSVAEIEELRAKSTHNPLVTRLIYNRPSYFLQRFSKNYFTHFSPQFLFLKGGSHFQFSVPQNGLIYPISAPFLILGLFYILKRKNRHLLILLLWFLLAPIASSLTREAPHVLRASVMLPVPMIIVSLGVGVINSVIKEKYVLLVTSLFAIGILLFLESYLVIYFGDYKKFFSWSWQYGYKEAVDFTKRHYHNYDKIIVTKKYGEPHEFFLFYWQWNSEEYKSDANLIRFYQSNWYWVDRFDKFYFVNDWDIPKEDWQKFKFESGGEFSCLGIKCLLITSPANYPKTWKIIDTVYFLDGKPAFEFYENQK